MGLSISNLHGTVGEFQRNYLYMLYIEVVPDVLITQFPDATNFQSQVDLYNTKAIFPDRKTSKINIKWGGEFINIPGVDESTRDSDLEFIVDEPMKVYDFFSACKDLTGNEVNQASVYSTQSKLQFGVAQISVDKNTIRNYRRLEGVRVYGVTMSEVTKDGQDLNKLTINIAWDRNSDVKSKRNTLLS